MSTPTVGALRTSMRAPTARSPPQPKSGCSARSSGAIGSGSMVACGVEAAGAAAGGRALPGDAAPAQRRAERFGRCPARRWRAAGRRPRVRCRAGRARAARCGSARRWLCASELVHACRASRRRARRRRRRGRLRATSDEDAARRRPAAAGAADGRRRSLPTPALRGDDGCRRGRRWRPPPQRVAERVDPVRRQGRAIRSRSSARWARALPLRLRRGMRSTARPATSAPSSASVPLERRVGGACRAASGPRRARTPATPVAQRRAVQLAVAASAAGQRPSTCAVRGQRAAGGRRRARAGSALRSSGARRASARRVDRAAASVGAAAGRRRAGPGALQPVAGGDELERRRGVAVAVGEARRRLRSGTPASSAVGDASASPCRASPRAAEKAAFGARRSAARGRSRPCALRRFGAAREQRVGAAGPPRRRIEVERAPPGRSHATARRRPCARQPAGERRLRAAEARFGERTSTTSAPALRLEAQPRRLRRGARQAAIGELAGERRRAARPARVAGVAAKPVPTSATLPSSAVSGARASSADGPDAARASSVDVQRSARPAAAAGDAAAAERGSSRARRSSVCTSIVLGCVGPRAQLGLERAAPAGSPSFQRPARALRRSSDDARRLVEAAASSRSRWPLRRGRRRARWRRRTRSSATVVALQLAERPRRERPHDGVRVERLRRPRRRRAATRAWHATSSAASGPPAATRRLPRPARRRVDASADVGASIANGASAPIEAAPVALAALVAGRQRRRSDAARRRRRRGGRGRAARAARRRRRRCRCAARRRSPRGSRSRPAGAASPAAAPARSFGACVVRRQPA